MPFTTELANQLTFEYFTFMEKLKKLVSESYVYVRIRINDHETSDLKSSWGSRDAHHSLDLKNNLAFHNFVLLFL